MIKDGNCLQVRSHLTIFITKYYRQNFYYYLTQTKKISLNANRHGIIRLTYCVQQLLSLIHIFCLILIF